MIKDEDEDEDEECRNDHNRRIDTEYVEKFTIAMEDSRNENNHNVEYRHSFISIPTPLAKNKTHFSRHRLTGSVTCMAAMSAHPHSRTKRRRTASRNRRSNLKSV